MSNHGFALIRFTVSQSGQPNIHSTPTITRQIATTPKTSFTLPSDGGFFAQRFARRSQTCRFTPRPR